MNYFIKTWLCLFQLLTVLIFCMVVSSSPVPNVNTSITNQIKSPGCYSPSTKILDVKQLPESYCDIHESGLDDPRDILCQGLLDLHTTFCKGTESSSSSFKSLQFSEFEENSSVDEFCKTWKMQAKSVETSELFNHDSFKKITESCNIICITLGKAKLNPMCPSLLSGSRSSRVSALPESQRDIPVLMEPSSGQNPRMLAPSPRVEPAAVNPEMNPNDNLPGVGVTSAVVETPDNAHSPGIGTVNAMGKLDKEVPVNLNSPPPNPVVVSNDENKELTDDNGNIDGSDKNLEPLPVQPANNPPIKAQTSTLNNVPVSDLENQNNVQLQEKQMEVGEDGEANKENEAVMSKANFETPEVKNEPSLTKNNNLPVKPKTTNNLGESSQTAPKVNNELGDESYDNSMADLGNDQNMVAEQQSSQRELIPAKDMWVEAEDPHFFQYFMIISAAFILGYVALVNKKKIIALLVEGRRDGGRRRHHSASYSKLDSNLEEALSSNRSTVSSHQVLY